MPELMCYVFAFALLALAALLPPTVPHRDRLAYGGIALYVLPAMVHAIQTH